jgi:hypothetical protein
MRENKHYEDMLEQGIDLIDFYMENPCIAAYDLLGVDLAPIQRHIFKDMWFKDYIIAVCGRGVGKTFLDGTLAVLSCMLRPGYRVGLIAPSFRQSKMIFSEAEKLYAQSSILREACEKRPISQTDRCYIKFKSVAGTTPSYIEALPIGDGSKIRGSRFYLIIVDELAQVEDQLLDMVVRPMGATSLAPMERVRRLEQKKKLIDLGIAKEEDFIEETVNKMVMTSSGYYKFNHMWRRMKDHWNQIDKAAAAGKKSAYAVWQVPYWDLPSGFLDVNNISEAKRVMSNSEFRMEYEAAMISDSEGFFKASLLDSCTLGSGHSIELKGDHKSQYIIGIDPNQGGAGSGAGIVVVRLGPVSRIVNVLEVEAKSAPEQTKILQELCDTYNVIRVFMDQGGGGKAVRDLLEEGYDNKTPIIDRTNKDHRHLPGRHILEMVNFNPSWISDANFTTKSMFEDKKLLFPEVPSSSVSDLDAQTYDNVLTLKSQLLNIIVSQTATGMLHFDTPIRGQKKDVYSATILAAHGIKIIERELEEEQDPILHNSGGLIRMRDVPSKDFSHIKAGGPKTTLISSAALLKKRNK